MKTLKILPAGGNRCLCWIVIILAFLFLAGCSTVNVETKRYPEAGIYAPMPYQSVVILRTPPNDRYQRLGEIHIQPQDHPSQAEILKQFKKAAAKIGADAVVLVADPAVLTGGPVAGAEWWNRELAPGPGRTIVGVAIWYPRPAY